MKIFPPHQDSMHLPHWKPLQSHWRKLILQEQIKHGKRKKW